MSRGDCSNELRASFGTEREGKPVGLRHRCLLAQRRKRAATNLQRIALCRLRHAAMTLGLARPHAVRDILIAEARLVD